MQLPTGKILAAVCIYGLYLSACDVADQLLSKAAPQVSDIESSEPGFTVDPLDTVSFRVTATDPQDEVLTYIWEVSGGEIIGSGRNDNILWRAPVTGGSYSIRVSVSNSEETTVREGSVTVRDYRDPVVVIIEPPADAYVIQYSTIGVIADAVHENGIQQVSLFVADSLIETVAGSGQSKRYELSWRVQEKPGPVQLRIEAIAQTSGTTGTDRREVIVQGIIPGKRNGK